MCMSATMICSLKTKNYKQRVSTLYAKEDNVSNYKLLHIFITVQIQEQKFHKFYTIVLPHTDKCHVRNSAFITRLQCTVTNE